MAWQLVYTSASRGLIAGRSGFCTVARHAEIRDRVVAEVERYSAYDRRAVTQTGGQIPLPIIASHRILDIAGTRYHLLSRIRDAGLDYTGRTSHIAHHIICEEHEIHGAVSPSSILRAFPWYDAWNEPARHFTDLERVDLQTAGKPLRLPAQHWRQLTGRADNAALLVEHIGMPGCSMLCAAGSAENNLLCLFDESLQLLNADGASAHKLWSVRFTTFLQASENSADFDWRGGWAGFATAASDRSRGPILDITRSQELPYPKDPVLMRYAETGVPPARPRPPASSSGSVKEPAIRWAQSQAPTRGPAPGEIANQHQQTQRRKRLIVIGSSVGIVMLLLMLLLLVIHYQKAAGNKALPMPAANVLHEGPSQRTQFKQGEEGPEQLSHAKEVTASSLSSTQRASPAGETSQPTNAHTSSGQHVVVIVETAKSGTDLGGAKTQSSPVTNPPPARSSQIVDGVSKSTGELESSGSGIVKPVLGLPANMSPAQSTRLQAQEQKQMLFDSLPAEPTYLVLANLAKGVDLHELFTRNAVATAIDEGGSRLDVKMAVQDKHSWDHFPDAANGGMKKAYLAYQDKQWRFSFGAALPIGCLTEAGLLSRTGNSSWQLAVFRFQRNYAVFQVLLMENAIIKQLPFPLFTVDRNLWFSLVSGQPGKYWLRNDFFPNFKLRSFFDPSGTKVRLCSHRLMDLFGKDYLNQQPTATLKDRGQVDGGACIDCDALVKQLTQQENKLKSPDQPTTEPPPDYNKIYLNKIQDLKGFLQKRPKGFTVNPWADCMDYFGHVARKHLQDQIVDATRKLEHARKNRLSPEDKAELEAQLNDFHKDENRLPEEVESAKNNWSIVFDPGSFWERCVPWNQLPKKFKEDVDSERRFFEANYKNRNAPQQPDPKKQLKHIEEIRTKIPTHISELGEITLEMEVGRNVWWPVVKFDGRREGGSELISKP